MEFAAASARESTSEAASPIANSLGLNSGDIDLMDSLFCELMAALGIDGSPIFQRLRLGQSIGQALAIPETVIERIYARAHRWFAHGKVDKATALFRALCLLRDEDADFWLGYGVCLRVERQLHKAEKAFESAASLKPDWALPYFHMLELALHQKQWAQARAALLAYDARSDQQIPPEITSEIARLRVALEQGLHRGHADALPTERPLTPLTSAVWRSAHEC